MTDGFPPHESPGHDFQRVLPERDEDRFEEVLERLDALVRRGQPENDPPPPPPAVSEASIPVLTEIYEPEPQLAHGPSASSAETLSAAESSAPIPTAPGLSTEAKLEQAMGSVLPMMVDILAAALAQKVRPQLEQALDRILDDLRPELEEMLRQRLRQTLAAEENQTEM